MTIYTVTANSDNKLLRRCGKVELSKHVQANPMGEMVHVDHVCECAQLSFHSAPLVWACRTELQYPEAFSGALYITEAQAQAKHCTGNGWRRHVVSICQIALVRPPSSRTGFTPNHISLAEPH